MDAMMMLASYYRSPVEAAAAGIAVDAREDFAWTLRAAEAGAETAFEHVATSLFLGSGVAVDKRAAHAWYVRAAAAGELSAHSAIIFADLLEKGVVCAADEAGALALYKRVVADADADADMRDAAELGIWRLEDAA